MDGNNSSIPGFKTPLLSPHRPPVLQVSDGEIKVSVDPKKLSPRVLSSNEGAGIRTPRTPIGEGKRSADSPLPKRSGPNFLRRAADAVAALSPKGRHEKLKAESVDKLKVVVKLLSKIADESEVTPELGEKFRSALETTPGQKDSKLQFWKISGGSHLAAKEKKSSALRTPAQQVERAALFALTHVISTDDLDERSLASDGGNNYFDLLVAHRPKNHFGDRSAFYRMYFQEVAEVAVAQMQLSADTARAALVTIDRLIDRAERAESFDVLAHLSVLKTVIEVNEASEVRRRLFENEVEAVRAASSSEARQIVAQENPIAQFESQVATIRELMHTPQYPLDQRAAASDLIAQLVVELSPMYDAIAGQIQGDSREFASLMYLCKNLASFGLVNLHCSNPELEGQYHAALDVFQLRLVADQVKAIQREAEKLFDDPRATQSIATMVTALAPAFADAANRYRYRPDQLAELEKHRFVLIGVLRKPEMDWKSVSGDLATDFNRAIAAMNIGFRRAQLQRLYEPEQFSVRDNNNTKFAAGAKPPSWVPPPGVEAEDLARKDAEVAAPLQAALDSATAMLGSRNDAVS